MAILPGQIGGAIVTLGGLASSNRTAVRNMRNMKGSGSNNNDNDNDDENDNSKRSLIRLIVTVVICVTIVVTILLFK